MKKSADHPNQLLLFASVVSNGTGGFTIIPGKPVIEVGPGEAAQLLGVCRSSLSNLLDRPKAQEIIRWRWISESHGKRLFDTQSLLKYREATADPEFGAGRKISSQKSSK